jgi:hypothetical protein
VIGCCAGPRPAFFSTKVHEGHEEECASVDATAVGTCLRHVPLRVSRAEASRYRLRGVVDHSTTPTRAATKNPRPAESVAVREGKLQSRGLGFGAKCKKPFWLHTLLTHRNLRHARRRLKRAFRFRRVLWLLSSKGSNNKKNPCSKNDICLRHGMGRDTPVLGWMAGRESRATCFAPDFCPAVFCPRRYTKGTKGNVPALTLPL